MKLAVVDHLLGFNTEVLDHDLLNPLANLTHRLNLVLVPLDPTAKTLSRRYELSWSLNFLRYRA